MTVATGRNRHNKMKLTKAQQNELEVFCYFSAGGLKPSDFSEEELKEYYDWSERGIGSNVKNTNRIGQAKRWTGVTMGMYEQGILDGTMPYVVILGKQPYNDKPVPRSVVDFMKKEMFKGANADIIENCYVK